MGNNFESSNLTIIKVYNNQNLIKLDHPTLYYYQNLIKKNRRFFFARHHHRRPPRACHYCLGVLLCFRAYLSSHTFSLHRSSTTIGEVHSFEKVDASSSAHEHQCRKRLARCSQEQTRSTVKMYYFYGFLNKQPYFYICF